MASKQISEISCPYGYVIVTSIPVYRINGGLYVDDNWAKDIIGQIGLWDNVEILCPIKNKKDISGNLISIPKNILFSPYKNFSEFITCLNKTLKLAKEKNNILFEFAGTSSGGTIGFIIAKILAPEVPIFITFDAPLSMLLFRHNRLSMKKILVHIYLKMHRMFRRWAAVSANAENYLIIPLTLFDEESLHKKAESSAKELYIACTDRMSPEKGVYELVIAFTEVINKVSSKVVLHLFGTGPQYNLIKKFVNENELTSRVILHGRIEHSRLMQELDKADILVNLTKVGDINRTMWEGAAKNCAIIASDLPGVRSFFENGENAILINPTNVNDISNALILLSLDDKKRRYLADNALQLASNNTNRNTKIKRKKWILSRIDTQQ